MGTPKSLVIRRQRSSETALASVLPQELLRHVYRSSKRTWRLLVVDVRRSPAQQYALPGCLRIDTDKCRRAALDDLTVDRAQHICLLGDGPAMPGDEAFELYEYLTGRPSLRRCVSTVAGGWPAVERLARQRRVELQWIGKGPPPEGSMTPRAMTPRAMAAAEEVSQIVSLATNSAASEFWKAMGHLSDQAAALTPRGHTREERALSNAADELWKVLGRIGDQAPMLTPRSHVKADPIL